MEFQFDNNIPIYIQLVEQLKVYVISGKLKAGDRLPSVREIAMLSRTNPNTVQKALTSLEESGLIYTERTNGKFVCNDDKKLSHFRLEYAKIISGRFYEDMRKIGFTKEETLEFLEKAEGEL